VATGVCRCCAYNADGTPLSAQQHASQQIAHRIHRR